MVPLYSSKYGDVMVHMYKKKSVSTTLQVSLRENVVQIVYATLEATTVGIREVRGCTPTRVRLTVQLIATQDLQQFRVARQGLIFHYYSLKLFVLQYLR